MKRYLSLIIAIFLSIAVASMCACASGFKSHSWSEGWSHDISSHFHVCTDEGCYGRNETADHDWTLVTTSVQPTCGSEGFGVYKCSVCNAYKEDVIPPTNAHDYELIISVSEPTCHSEGNGVYRCKVCGVIATKPVPATQDHVFGTEWEADESGHFHVCTNSGCTERSEVIPHTEGDPVIHNASGGNDGIMEYRCTECGYVIRSEAVPAADVPVSLELTLIRNLDSQRVVLEEYNDGYRATLCSESSIPGSSESQRRYSVSLVGKNAAGDTISAPFVGMGDNKGVMVYDCDPIDGHEVYIGDTNDQEDEIHDVKCFSNTLMYLTNGEYEIVFRYETGIISGEHKVRAELKLYLTVVDYVAQ